MPIPRFQSSLDRPKVGITKDGPEAQLGNVGARMARDEAFDTEIRHDGGLIVPGK